jgi:hypothetical protein
MKNRVRTALFLAGGFNSRAFETEPATKLPARCKVQESEIWDGTRWVTRRTVWNEAEQRYAEAA